MNASNYMGRNVESNLGSHVTSSPLTKQFRARPQTAGTATTRNKLQQMKSAKPGLTGMRESEPMLAFKVKDGRNKNNDIYGT